MAKEKQKCFVSGIQHFSPSFGHGLRTTVFFSGCPLRCRWCCNPECRLNTPVLVCNTERCIGASCLRCVSVCQNSAIYISRNHISVARDLCRNCGECTTLCPSGALFMSGKKMGMKDIMNDVLKDKAFIMSGGGLTLSGGEPLMHSQEAAELLALAHEQGLHTAIETCGYFDMDASGTIAALQETDLLYFDIKHSDPGKHRQFTGVDNSRILGNYERVIDSFPHIELVGRTLIVPGFNDDEITLRNIARIVKKCGNCFHVLEAFSSLCQDKYLQTGIPFEYGSQEVPADTMKRAVDIFLEEGITCEVY